MRYVSTRGDAPVLDFGDTLLAGLASDGGLYVPERWPMLAEGARERLADARYQDVAVEVITPFVEGSLDHDELAALVEQAYASFDDPAVVPLRALEDGYQLLELFHGPTLAFKDVALQLVGPLFEHELERRRSRVTIVGATSGDTGSAAIEACRDRKAIDIFILHPLGRVSEVQRRQMTTVDSPNVHNIAIEGTFDDCQDLVKSLFADVEFRERRRLSAVNSMNWARVVAQIVYYVAAWARIGGGSVSFAVPTGNFGNVFSGYVASRMGVDVDQFVVGSNRNDILTRFFATGTMTMTEVHPTISPSMDIQVSSNFERLLFELYGRAGHRVAATMAEFRATGSMTLGADELSPLAGRWTGARLDDEQTRLVMKEVHERLGVLLDPHTAVGLGAGREVRRDPSVPMVCLATAHPAKFPDAVEAATGVRPALPPALGDLLDRPEHFDVVPNDVAQVRAFIDATLG
jgi:threonine synthase